MKKILQAVKKDEENAKNPKNLQSNKTYKA